MRRAGALLAVVAALCAAACSRGPEYRVYNGGPGPVPAECLPGAFMIVGGSLTTVTEGAECGDALAFRTEPGATFAMWETSTVPRVTGPVTVEPVAVFLPRRADLSGGGAETTLAGGGRDAALAGGGDERALSGGGREAALAGGGDERALAGGGAERALSGGGSGASLSGGGDERALAGGGHEASLSGGGDERALSGGGREASLSGGGDERALAGGGAELALGGGGSERAAGVRLRKRVSDAHLDPGEVTEFTIEARNELAVSIVRLILVDHMPVELFVLDVGAGGRALRMDGHEVVVFHDTTPLAPGDTRRYTIRARMRDGL